MLYCSSSKTGSDRELVAQWYETGTNSSRGRTVPVTITDF